jgi:phenylpropionate dioxygenase-like ring-hydroxylating dioxygenase large terminal subunit
VAGRATFLLEPPAYFAEEVFAREQRELFTRTWHLAGTTDQVAEPGDYLTFDAGTDPVVVMRGLDGVLRAFHNFCPHRGHRLLEGTGNTRTGIVCPYHFWNFALDGDLRKVPQPEQFDDVDLTRLGLVHASVAEWGGMVFACATPDADFSAWLAGFGDHIGTYEPARLQEIARVQFDARCNWKLFVENHVDVYHLWYLHARSLGAYDHEQFEWSQVGPHWVSYEPVRDGVERKRPHVGSRPIDGLATRDRIGIGAHMIFPNVLFATESEFFMSYVPTPTAADRCVVDVRIRGESGADAEMLIAAAKSFMLEDVAACEAIQSVVGSTRFRVGALAKQHEVPITNFHEHLQEYVAY